MKIDVSESADENICSPVVPNNAPFANNAAHKTRHKAGRSLFHRVDATLVLDLTAEAEQMAADRDRKFDIAYIYVIEASGLKLFKIGRANDIRNRLPSYRTECPVPCTAILVAAVPEESVGKIEISLHSHFAERRRKGEWFALTDDDLAYLPMAVKRFAAYPISRLKSHLRVYPTYNEHFVEHNRRLEEKLEELRAISAVPIQDYVLDRIAHAREGKAAARVKDIARDLRDNVHRKPQDTHDIVRALLTAGRIALVEPWRNPDTGYVVFDSYRECGLIEADSTCDWERTTCGREVMVSVKPGNVVPEYFGAEPL